MLWSQLYAPTLREDPADADAASHRLLLRGAFARQLMAGHYSLLPLGMRVHRKISGILREEMESIGGQQFVLPALHPAEIWRRTGRWEVMGEEMFRLRDRKGAELGLGMTHEEIFTTLSQELRSYRSLPQIWYQFQTKFRDEARPRSGLLRLREFTMKDSYSFDVDEAGLERSFGLHHDAYQRFFARIGLPVIPVQASSGSMGGNNSTEFMSASSAGEDLVARCPSCGYAANAEKAVAALPEIEDPAGPDAPEPFETPGVHGIEQLAETFDIPAERLIRTLVYVVDGEPVLVLLRGDHDLMEQKLSDALGAVSVRRADPEETTRALGNNAGSLGAVGVTKVRVIADEALLGRSGLTTGANTEGVHLRGVDVGRDISVAQWAPLRAVAEGEPCAECGTALEVLRTVEVGHIFKLGRKYTETMGVRVLGQDGERIAPVMGSYGIGIERAMASVVEAHHDDRGIVWPVSVAPFEVAVVVLGQGADVTRAAQDLYARLRGEGVDVLLDDRDERPGVKFRDVELIGLPCRVTVGARGLAEGRVEVTVRSTGETTTVPVDEVVGHVRSLLADLAV
ncbi:proline--tRNA ligase [Streptomyces sulfonofaciens]|uniref:Proline--tRNA ligase n=1 Tax=Streptomyces sulfonofaciens TaxID=68272 RepID=A0A919LAE3_9ACTN|nr:proline--tRNA ligase [Streptomyces sulfonofaciens]GHH88764.1 proline--tRNA ligase [Streptomyces sulfonofaciens]